MVLASRQVVETIRRFGLIEDLEVPTTISLVGIILYHLVQKSAYIEGKRPIIDAEAIGNHITHLQWAGLNVHSRENNCVFKYFISAIVPTLRFYNIDLQFFLDTLMECSSCAELSTIDRQACEFLMVQRTGVQGSLDTVIADLFGRVLQKRVCSKCLDEGPHYTSLTITNCPKHLFVHCEATETLDQTVFQLTPHIDISKSISNNITFTSSYCRYTLQSFITFYEKDNARHYYTYARYKEDWFCMDDTNVNVVPTSSIFQDQTKCRPIVLAHYIRPSETDVFSTALLNVFRNFSRQKPTLPPTLSLNDAGKYFAQNNITNQNLLNLVVIKRLDCTICNRETYTFERMHEIWQMRSTTQHINAEIVKFVHKEVKCSSCLTLGLTNFVVHDIPRFLLLNTRSDDRDCVKLIDEIDLLSIQPTILHPSFEYSIQTVLIVLEEDDIVYIRKNGSKYSSYNKISGQFEELLGMTAQQTGLASRWTIFVYETEAVDFNPPRLDKITFGQNNLQSALEPEMFTIDTVQGLLPSVSRSFNVGPVQMEQNSVNILLDKDGDLNDLVINGHLFLIASTAPSNSRVLAVDSLIISEILENRLKRINNIWLDYDIILCSIHQNKHWYLVVLDLRQKLILELDSYPTLNLPRFQNITRLLHFLNTQSLLRGKSEIRFQGNWKFTIPTENNKLQQTDEHSCGVYLLIQARAYVNNHKFVHISDDKVRLYRFQIAEDLLRKADLVPDDSDSSLPDMRPWLKEKKSRKQKQTKPQKQTSKHKHTTA